MKAERAKLARLRRLEAIRAVAKRAAAGESAKAEGTLAQLQLLAERTRLLAADYARRDEAADGAGLGRIGQFAGALQQLQTTTAGDAAKARVHADARLAELASAERRRAAVEDRADSQARRIASQGEAPALTSRRRLGTELE